MTDTDEIDLLLSQKANQKKTAEGLFQLLVKFAGRPLPLWGSTAKKPAVFRGQAKATKDLANAFLSAHVFQNKGEGKTSGSGPIVSPCQKATEIAKREDIWPLFVALVRSEERSIEDRLQEIADECKEIEARLVHIGELGFDGAGAASVALNSVYRAARSVSQEYRHASERVEQLFDNETGKNPPVSKNKAFLDMLDNLSEKAGRFDGLVRIPDLRQSLNDILDFEDFDSTALDLRDAGDVRLEPRNDGGFQDLENAVKDGGDVFFYIYRR